jgi:uncharacterized protein
MTVLYWLLVAVMMVGIVGAVVPGVPGISLIFGAILIWGAVHGFSGLTIPLTVAIVVLLLGIGIDFLATYWGAQKAGASQWGQIGAVVGLLAGFFGLLPALPVGGPLVGILLGPLLGALIGELIYRRDLGIACKAAIGILVGSLVGNLIQGVLAIATVAVFLITTWPSLSVSMTQPIPTTLAAPSSSPPPLSLPSQTDVQPDSPLDFPTLPPPKEKLLQSGSV